MQNWVWLESEPFGSFFNRYYRLVFDFLLHEIWVLVRKGTVWVIRFYSPANNPVKQGENENE
jgi:hypothetical protein